MAVITMIIFIILVYAIFLSVYIVIRKSMKFHNPKYHLFDDFLLFSGTPLFFAYILLLLFNPYHRNITVFNLINTPLTYILMAWMLVSNVVLFVRFERNRIKTEKEGKDEYTR